MLFWNKARHYWKAWSFDLVGPDTTRLTPPPDEPRPAEGPLRKHCALRRWGSREIQIRYIGNCLKADPAYGKGVADALGIPLSEIPK